jgi:hypothetical protein
VLEGGWVLPIVSVGDGLGILCGGQVGPTDGRFLSRVRGAKALWQNIYYKYYFVVTIYRGD